MTVGHRYELETWVYRELFDKEGPLRNSSEERLFPKQENLKTGSTSSTLGILHSTSVGYPEPRSLAAAHSGSFMIRRLD